MLNFETGTEKKLCRLFSIVLWTGFFLKNQKPETYKFFDLHLCNDQRIERSMDMRTLKGFSFSRGCHSMETGWGHFKG